MQQMTIFDIDVYCEHELQKVDMGQTLKSLCARMGCWTNCRDFGSCVYELWKGKGNEPIDNKQRA